MVRRPLIAAFALGAILVADASSALAKVNLNIIIGTGGGYTRQIECWEGREIVRRWFNRVRYLDCSGKYYSYRGKSEGIWYRIKVNSLTARIVSVSEY